MAKYFSPVKGRKLGFSLLVFLVTFFAGIVQSQGSSCDFSTLCAEADWSFPPGKYYHYDFVTEQHLSIKSRGDLQDTQTLRMEGHFILTPRTDNESCAMDMEVTNVTVSYPELDTKTVEKTLRDNITRSIHVAFAISPSEENYVICLPTRGLGQDQGQGQEEWENNLARSLASAMKPNYHQDCSNHSSEILDKCSVLPGGLMWPYSGQVQIWSDPCDKKRQSDSRRAGWIQDMRNFTDPRQGWECLHAEYGLKGAHSKMVTSYWRQEERIVFGGSFITTNTSTVTNIGLVSVESDQLPTTTRPELNVETMLFDKSPPRATSDPKVIQNFLRALPKLCDLDRDSEATIEFMDKMRKLARVIRIQDLREGEQMIKNKMNASKHDNFCDQGLNLYYDLLASSPSDDTVEFIVDLLLSGGGSPELFKKFSYAALLVPSTLPEEEPYARERAVRAVIKLLDERSTLVAQGLVEDDSKLIFPIVGFLKKIRNAVDSHRELVLKLDNFIGNGTMDRGARLEVRRGIDKSLTSRITGLKSNTCKTKEVDMNDYEILKCLDPCGHDIGNLMADTSKAKDLQILAYLQMRKCYFFNKMSLVTYLNGDYGCDEEVKKFIHHHSASIGEEISMSDPNFVPGPSKLGRTYSYNLPNLTQTGYFFPELDTSLRAELNVVLADDSLPRLISLDFTYTSFHGVGRFWEIEILRVPDTGANNSEKQNVFITLRGSGVTFMSKTTPLDIGKIKKMLQEFGEKLKNPSSSSGTSLSAKTKIKAMIDSLLQKLFQNRDIQVFKTLLFEDRLRQVGTSSGLPLKSGVRLDGALSFNYKWDVDWKNGEFEAIFQLNPALSWKNTESASIGFGHNDILGYEVGMYQNLEFNLGVNFTTRDDQRTFVTKLSFSPPSVKNDPDGHSNNTPVFFKNAIKLLQISRIQYLDSFTRARRSGHIWSEPQFAHANRRTHSEKFVQLKDQWAFFEDGKCVNKIGKMEEPFHYDTETFCTIPDIYIVMQPSIKNASRASLEFKIYPENPTINNTYAGRLSISVNRKEYSYIFGLELDTPKRQSQFQAKLITSSFEKSIQVTASLNGAVFGGQLFLKQKMVKDAKEIRKLFDVSRRNRRTTDDAETDLVILPGRNPWSHKQYEFGLNVWPGDGLMTTPIKLLEGGILYLDQELISLWMGFDSGGRFAKMNTRLTFTASTKYNTTQTVDLDGFVVPSMRGDVSDVALELRNEFYGNVSILGTHFKSRIPHRGPQATWISVDKNGGSNFTQVDTGSLVIPYSIDPRRELTLLKLDYTKFELLDDLLTYADDPSFRAEKVARAHLNANLESPTFPVLNTGFKVFFITEIIPPDSSNPVDEMSYQNATKKMEITLQAFKAYPLMLLYSVVKQTMIYEASLGPLARFRHRSGLCAEDCPEELDEIEVELCHGGNHAIVKYSDPFRYLTVAEMGEPGEDLDESWARTYFVKVTKASSFELELVHKNNDVRYLVEQPYVAGRSAVRLEIDSWRGNRLKFVLEGNSSIITHYDEVEGKNSKKVSMFNGTLSEENWTEPMKIYFKDEPNLGFEGITSLVVNDTENMYLNLDMVYDLRNPKETSADRKLLTVRLMAKDYVKVNLDVEATKLIAKVDVIPKDFTVNANLAWSGDTMSQSQESNITFFRGGLNAYSLENPRLRYFVLDTENEVKTFPASESIKQLPSWLKMALATQNAKLNSKTKLRIKSVSQKLTFIFQLLPEESDSTSASPVLFLEWVLPTADKFSVKIKKQLLLRLKDEYNSSMKKMKQDRPCFVAGHWITMEQPGYDPLTSEMILKGFCSSMFNLISGKATQDVILDTSFQSRIQHPEFFIPNLDMDSSLNGNFLYSVAKVGHALATSDEEQSNVQPWIHFFHTDVKRQLNISLIPDNRVNLSPTSLSLNYNNYLKEVEADERGQNVIVSLGHDSLVHDAHLSYHMSRVSTAVKTDVDVFESEFALQTVDITDDLNNGLTLYKRSDTLSYGYSKSNGLERTTLSSHEGKHVTTAIFDSWKYFWLTGSHRINVPWLNTTWDDGIYVRLIPDPMPNSLQNNNSTTSEDARVEIYSTKLFKVKATKGDAEGSRSLDLMEIVLIPTSAKSHFRSQAFKPEPNSAYSTWNTTCESVFLPEAQKAELTVKYRFTYEEPSSLYHMAHILYKIPFWKLTLKGDVRSAMHQSELKLEVDNMTTTTVSHNLNIELMTESNGSRPTATAQSLRLLSTTSLLHNEEGQAVFLHRDFRSTHSSWNYSGTEDIFFPAFDTELNGFLSISGPTTMDLQQPQIAQSEVHWNREGFGVGNKRFWEGFIRLGQVDGDMTKICRSNDSSFERPIEALKLGEYFNQKLYCERNCVDDNDDDNETRMNCSNSTGTLWAEKRLTDLNHTLIKGETLTATWDKEGECVASKNDSILVTSDLGKDLSKECTSILGKMKERNPCWFGGEDSKCDKSAKNKAAMIWNKFWEKLGLFRVALAMDSVTVGVNFIGALKNMGK